MKNLEIINLLNALATKPIPRYTSYPTAPEWHNGNDSSLLLKRIKEVSSQKRGIALYLHIPFCQQQCWYCGCHTIIKKKSEHGEEYLGYLFKEIELITKNLNHKLKVEQLHLGGGTPNFLSENQFEKLFEKLNQAFEINYQGEIAIELDPRTCSLDKLNLLRHLGFNRLSFGVQDFHPEVQRAINRVQSFELVESLIHNARKMGFKSINLDLVYGLPLQTVENFRETLNQTIALKPDRLALYSFAYLPQMRPHMKLIKPETLPKTTDKLTLFMMARDYFLESGYQEVAMDHFALPGDELAIAVNNGKLKRNFMGYTVQNVVDSIGLGLSSISYIGNAYFQNEKELPGYYTALKNNSLPLAKVKELSFDDLVRQWVIQELMCNLTVSKKQFFQLFGKNFDQYFLEEKTGLDEVEYEGLVDNDSENFRVIDDGRLLIRYICSLFDKYLKQNIRLFSSLV